MHCLINPSSANDGKVSTVSHFKDKENDKEIRAWRVNERTRTLVSFF